MLIQTIEVLDLFLFEKFEQLRKKLIFTIKEVDGDLATFTLKSSVIKSQFVENFIKILRKLTTENLISSSTSL